METQDEKRLSSHVSEKIRSLPAGAGFADSQKNDQIMLDEEKTTSQLIAELKHYRNLAKKLETIGFGEHDGGASGEADKPYRHMIDKAGAAIFLLHNQRISYINQAGIFLFGKSSCRLYASRFWELVHPAFQSLVKTEMEALRNGTAGVLQEDVKVVHPERGGLWLHLHLSALHHKGAPSLLGVAFDVTDRKQSENTTSILFRISNAISDAQDLGTLFQTIHQILKDVIAAPNFFLSFISDGRIKLDFPFYINKTAFSRPIITNIQEPVGLALNLRVIRNRAPAYHQKPDLMKMAEAGDLTPGNQLPEVWLGVPLKVRGKTIGALCVEHYKDPFFYRQQDIDLMVAVSEQVAFAVERKTTQEILRLLATTDSLTGLLNRRYFLELAQREFDRTKRYGHGLSIIMLDVDHFKATNDRYGHGAGDTVLVALANLMKKNLREVDLIGRLGGEEFAILMPMTKTATALEVGERLRYVVEMLEVVTTGDKIKITISGGVASYRKGVTHIDDIIAAADQGLNAAKQKGRNRIEIIDYYPSTREES